LNLEFIRGIFARADLPGHYRKIPQARFSFFTQKACHLIPFFAGAYFK
jgi:hypothetical protein